MRVDLIQIGDYFAYPTQTIHDGKLKIGRVNFIRHDGIVQVDFVDTNAQLLKPIELTPEILEKNGFVKEEEERGFSEPYCVYVCDDFQYVIKIYPKSLMDRYSRLYIGEDDDNENGSLLINYFHELQHALKLFNIDKDIVP